jgi:hypothetical protein
MIGRASEEEEIKSAWYELSLQHSLPSAVSCTHKIHLQE